MHIGAVKWLLQGGFVNRKVVQMGMHGTIWAEMSRFCFLSFQSFLIIWLEITGDSSGRSDFTETQLLCVSRGKRSLTGRLSPFGVVSEKLISLLSSAITESKVLNCFKSDSNIFAVWPRSANVEDMVQFYTNSMSSPLERWRFFMCCSELAEQ